ncbi:MAG: carbonic anhydrase [Deltaproteobacteria bacterium]|nr:carbonic anhydrase [Deltaproteobacteria bacterium]
MAALMGVPAHADDGHGTVNPNSIETAIQALRDGNARFVASQPTHPNQTKERLKDLADHGQTPLAAVLACSDSRVPIEEIFDMGFGDLFVIRAAGAVPGVDQVGSLEYAVAHLGVPVILVLSHTNCGAVSAAVSQANEPGALGQLLKKLSPAAIAVEGLEGAKKLQTAIELSAVIFREQLPLVSPVLGEAVKSGKLAIISGVYDIATGQVDFALPKEKPQAPTEPAEAVTLPAPAPEPVEAVTLPAPAPDFSSQAETTPVPEPVSQGGYTPEAGGPESE